MRRKLDAIVLGWHPNRGMQLDLPLDLGARASSAPRLAPAPRAPAPGARARPPIGRAALEARIRAALQVKIELVVTDNRRTMISTKASEGRLIVRLHHMFLSAPSEVTEALLCYLADGDPRASRRIGRFIEAHRGLITRPRRRVRLRPKGEVHDLDALLEGVIREHLPEAADDPPAITWGRRPPAAPRRRRRSIRLGTFTHDLRLIRVHRALDDESVPAWFVAFVVFHELLHDVVPAQKRGGRLDYHPPAFTARERAHPDYARATRWERQHLATLLGGP